MLLLDRCTIHLAGEVSEENTAIRGFDACWEYVVVVIIEALDIEIDHPTGPMWAMVESPYIAPTGHSIYKDSM